ncbi:hypothetical protein ACFQAT_13745 [Undibacterium arcticum]|uniref:Uncharacterized protein n=1 Tax=Undibacterium arcticum TaxID=1762892 RepID=A0ABV7EXG5_9BURK
MDAINQPSKMQVRDWLKHRQLKTEPPPDIEQIRRELGWESAEKIKPAPSAVLQAVANI